MCVVFVAFILLLGQCLTFLDKLGDVKSQNNVLAIVLAGGEGKRLFPLTEDRAKPAVPFGGVYRLIDFVLSNLVNAGYLKICVLTQYKSHSLDRHISQAWQFSGPTSQYIASVPAQQRLGKHWYLGSADALLQSLNLIDDEKPDYVIVFGADHVYRMDPEQMVAEHIASGKAVSVAGIRIPRSEAGAFGCIQSDADGNITEFLEKPADPPGTPDDPDVTYASMGNYVFTTKDLIEALKEDEKTPDSTHDMGGDIIPYFVAKGQAHVYDFSNNDVPGSTERDKGYWRDVGTIDAFYEAHMDLISVHPIFNLYNQQWLSALPTWVSSRPLSLCRAVSPSPPWLPKAPSFLHPRCVIPWCRRMSWWRKVPRLKAPCLCLVCVSARALLCATPSWTRMSWSAMVP